MPTSSSCTCCQRRNKTIKEKTKTLTTPQHLDVRHQGDELIIVKQWLSHNQSIQDSAHSTLIEYQFMLQELIYCEHRSIDLGFDL